MLENALQAALIDIDGGIELAALEQFLGEPAPRIHIAGNFHLGAGAAQLAVRIHHAPHARSGATRRCAAQCLAAESPPRHRRGCRPAARARWPMIHSIFRPVLMTCTINPAWTAMDRIGMRYKGEISGSRSFCELRAAYCSQNRPGPALSRRAMLALALCYANPALHFAAVGPPDVRQGIPQHALRACIDGDFHLAAVESGRSAGQVSAEETTRTPTSSRSGRSCAARRTPPAVGSPAFRHCPRLCSAPIGRHSQSDRSRPEPVSQGRSPKPWHAT